MAPEIEQHAHALTPNLNISADLRCGLQANSNFMQGQGWGMGVGGWCFDKTF